MTKYYVKLDGGDWREVSMQEYISAEKAVGFRSKFGPDHIATASFGGNGISGKTTE